MTAKGGRPGTIGGFFLVEFNDGAGDRRVRWCSSFVRDGMALCLVRRSSRGAMTRHLFAVTGAMSVRTVPVVRVGSGDGVQKGTAGGTGKGVG